jgi:2-succinyl-5-enolpyruvyl-6-hydroxy-3-cyclohexene-1-carboxylate synthase
LVASQDFLDLSIDKPDILIHIGEITGDYDSISMVGREVWRVSEDGEIRDTFRKLQYVFEMDEKSFFEHYSDASVESSDGYLRSCALRLEDIRSKVPDLPFSNIWLASQLAHHIPPGSVIHFGILNSLRSWNFFELPESVRSTSNVGGFGIDGGLSSLIGASLANPNKLYFGIIGDLAFFYDMNVLGNRHVGNNLRILLVNNGKGTEFRQYNHVAAHFGDDADDFVSAAGHFGQKSEALVKNYAMALGFYYLAARSKIECKNNFEEFVSTHSTNRSILFEVFTDSHKESLALERIRNIATEKSDLIKNEAKKVLRRTPLIHLRNKLRKS